MYLATVSSHAVARRLAGQEELPGPEHGGALPESYPGRGNQGCESLILSFSILAHNATTLARLAALREVAGRAEVAVAGAARDLLRHGGVYQPRLRVEILEIDLSPGTHAVARAQVDVMSSEHVWTLMGLLTGRAPGISSVSRLDVVLRAQGVDAQQLLSNPAKLQRFQGDARQGLLDVVQRVSGLHASASAWTELKGLVGTGPGLADVLSTINFLGSSDGEAAVKALRGSLQDGPLKVQMGNGAMAMLSLAPGSPQAHEDRSSSLLKESMGVVSGNAEAIGLGEVSHGAAECHADDHRPPGRALLDNRELVHSRTTRQRTAFGGQYGLDSDPSALASSSLTPEHGVKYNHLHRYGGESSVESYYGSSSEYSSSADRPGSSSGQDRSSAGISSALISSAQLSSESSSTSGGQSYGSSLPFGDSSSQQAASASPVRKGRGQISNQSGGSSSPDKSNARKLPGSSDGPSEPTESERTPSSTARRLPSSSSQDSSAQKQKPNDAAKAPDVAMGSETSGGSSSSSQQRIRPGHSIPVEVTESSYGLSSQDTTSSSTHHANQPVAMIPPQTPRTPTPLATNTNPGRPEVKAAPESTDPRWNSSPGAHQAGDSSGTSSASMPVTHGMSEPQQPIASPGAPSPLSTVGIPNETPTPTTAPSAPTLAAGGSSEALDPLPEAATTSPSRPVPRMTADGVSDSSQSHVAPSMSSTPVINMATPILSTIPVTSSEALDPSSGGAPTPSTLMYPLPRETTEGTAEWSHSHTTPTAYLPIKTVAPPPTGEPRPNDFDALSETSAIAPSLTQTATRQVIEDESDSSQSHSVPELHTPIITIPVPFPTRAASSSSDASANPSHAATASPVLPPVATAHLPGPAWTVASPGSTPRPEEAAPTGAIPVEPAPAVTPRITGLTSGPSPTLLPTPPGSLMEPSTIPDTTPQTTSDAVPGNTLQPSEQFPAATPFLTSIPTPDVDPVPTGEPPGPDVAPQATGKTTPPPTGQTTQPSSTPQSIVPSPTASPVGTAPSLSAQPMRSVFFISDFTGRDVNQLAEDPLQLQELEALYIDSFRRIPGLLGLNTPEAVKLLQITLDVGVVPSIYTEVRFGQERDAQEFARVLQTLEGAGSNELGFGSVELRNVFTGAPGQGDNPPPAAQPSEVSATGDGQQQNVRAPAPGVDAAAVVGFFGALSTRCVMDCRGQCCAAPGRLDARLECCQDRVDECGVCAGDATSCAIGGNITVAMKQQGLSADRVGTGVKHGLVNAFADFHLDPMESIEVEHVSNRGALYKGKEVVSVLFVITPGGGGFLRIDAPLKCCSALHAMRRCLHVV